MIEGELTAQWKQNGKTKKQTIKAGDLVEVGHTPHTFTNHTKKHTKFLVIKQLLQGKNHQKLFKTDKILDE